MQICQILDADDASRRPEDASYGLDILTRCAVSKDGLGKKKIKIVPLKEPGEPLVVSVPLSQVNSPYFLVIYIFSVQGACTIS